MASSECDYLFKVLLIGNSGVGKSCFLMRFSENQFTNHFYNTIGVDFKIKVMNVDNASVKLQIWDTAGQDRFRTITSSYYRGAQGIIVMFDVTDRDSFDQVRAWMSEIDKFATDQVIKILVGNKVDMGNMRRVTQDEAQALASSYNVNYIEASAKGNIKVEETFIAITRQIIQKSGKSKPQQKIGMKLQQQQKGKIKENEQTQQQCCI
ncbi:hypothetical protein pb186bvf_019810 [Paramecium bursaria]